jgi:Tfp pilus assembly protein PilF
LNLVSAEVGDERIQAGFDAFRSGDVKAAEQLLRDVLQDDESNPQAHNNLGFILMCQHKYPAASQEFSRARELGYSELPIWSVNLGCCFYGLGEYEQAAKVFEQSLAMSSPTYAVLCAISDTDLKAVSLTSASNFVALVSLNIAWALARLRKPKDARKHADVSARLLDQIEGDDRSYFDQSLLRLQAFVKGLTTPS